MACQHHDHDHPHPHHVDVGFDNEDVGSSGRRRGGDNLIRLVGVPSHNCDGDVNHDDDDGDGDANDTGNDDLRRLVEEL